MTVDLDTVTLQGTYRIGFKPPAPGSLVAGELYLEVGSGAPRLWVGAMDDAGFAGGMASFGVAEAGPLAPPYNRAVPYVGQEDAVLNCTMGEWDGEPTAYAYQWKLDGATDIGDGTATYTFLAADVGHAASCVVSATNAAGTTAAPPSNEVVIAPVAGVETALASERVGPPTPRAEPEPRTSETHGRAQAEPKTDKRK